MKTSLEIGIRKAARQRVSVSITSKSKSSRGFAVSTAAAERKFFPTKKEAMSYLFSAIRTTPRTHFRIKAM